MRTLIVGDIHGCWDELQQLLDAAGIGDGDELIALGDIVDRGPDSVRVLEFFTTRPGVRTLIGNHERKHVRSFRGEIRAALSQKITRQQFGEERYPAAVGLMAGFPYWLDLPQSILVHGFFEPGVPLEAQRETVLAGTMGGEMYLKQTCSQPWYELYDGPKPLIVGHRNYLRTGEPLVWRDRVFGIDTDCVRGGILTGLVLPEFRLVRVPAARNHWSLVMGHYAAPMTGPAVPWGRFARALARAKEAADDDDPESVRELEELRALRDEAEARLAGLVERVEEEKDRITGQLRERDGYDTPPEAVQGKLYAAEVAARCSGNRRLAGLLFEARKGTLTPEAVKRQFAGPRELLAFVPEPEPLIWSGMKGESAPPGGVDIQEMIK